MIHIAKPLLGLAEQQAAAAVIASGWVTQGPKVAEFEKAFAAYCGAKHAVAVTSCTAALHLSLLAAGVGPGDEVICPSMTYVATANAVLYCGGKPVFADIGPGDYNIDPAAIEPLITPRTKALLPVHQIGQPADMDRICAIARANGLTVVEDAACAAGSEYRGHKIGRPFGKFVCFSFYPRKLITTGEGGMITTDDDQSADRLRLLRQHGMSVPETVRHGAKGVVVESFVCVGYNYRMTDIQAAIGIEQLKRLDGIVDARRRLAAKYNEALAKVPGIGVLHEPAGSTYNYQNYSVLVTEKAKRSRDDLMIFLRENGVASRPGISLVHREPAYAADYGLVQLPVSQYAFDHAVMLPLYPQMTDDEQQQVIQALRDALT